MTWYRRLYFPSEGRGAEDFFALKNPMASAGFEPAKSIGVRGGCNLLREFDSVYASIVLKFVGHVILKSSKEVGPIIVSKE
jgi:hypothetical protein